ncbi:MAG: hypothetical protein R2932_19860 [Caldilineaceae bacterium]
MSRVTAPAKSTAMPMVIPTVTPTAMSTAMVTAASSVNLQPVQWPMAMTMA